MRSEKRISLTLRKDGLQKIIRELDKSTADLERLQRLIASTHTSAATSTSRSSSKSAHRLHRVRQLAERLHQAFSQHWSCGCHDMHEVKLLLDDRLDLILNHRRQRKGTIAFDLIVSSNWDDPCPVWHETVVEASIEDENDAVANTINASLATLSQPVGPRVTVLDPKDGRSRTSAAQVQNICVSIGHATACRKKLRLYVGSQYQLSYDHTIFNDSRWNKPTTTVTLERLLVGSSQRRLSLKDRMTLAVNLASSLLQLQNTSWLGPCWTKQFIHFATENTPSTSQSHCSGPKLRVSAETGRPFVLSTFANPRHIQQLQTGSNARSALLELGILLLELWHETTFEARFTNTAIPSDYFARFRLAWEWLEDVHNPPPDLYNAAMSQCVKCFFGGKTVSFDWEDVNFRRAVCQDIIEPLHKTCKQWM